MKTIYLKLKFTLLCAILICSALISKAQDSPVVKKGHSGNVELIIGLPEIGLNTTQGFRFNNHWFVGGNTGVNISFCGPVIPLCAVGQFDFLNDHNSSLFVNTKVGTIFATYPDGKNWNNYVGGNFALGVGFRYKRMSYQLAYNVVLLKHRIHDSDEIAPGYATIQLRIGYNFGKR